MTGWLNYQHLFYFRTIVREGSVSAAAKRLRLSQPTVSEQLRALEHALGVELFQRKGKHLVLTERGTHVYRYADEIFTLGGELMDSLAARDLGARLVVGIADAVPKLVASRILEPALAIRPHVRLVCHEERQDRLLAALSIHALDVVVSDAPVPPQSGVRATSHLLGECGVSFFAKADLAARLRRRFPKSLDGAQFIMPTDNSSLRHAVTGWLESEGLRPDVRVEVEDSALAIAFGQAGVGVFVAQRVVESAVRDQYGVEVVGRTDDVRERFYAITVERRTKSPATQAILTAARRDLFG
ncbi:MAG TPA: transcriptional activator NhaR [Polyangiaceae bacterium]|nr:transcriptional activator NhaR [Polyangiaceae bacterium]